MLAVAMATYNGAAYVEEQILSIRRQTLSDWTLFVSDDNSTDQTWKVVERCAAADARIRLLPPAADRLGAKRNFARVAEHAHAAGADYLAFSDQDDVWFPEKLAQQLHYMQSLERESTDNRPVLIHTDAEVASRTLARLAPSVHAYNGQLQDYSNAFGHLLLHNSVHGCTAMLNRPLMDLAMPVPHAAVDHDWWFALCAAAAGTVGYLPAATMQYRQHGENCVGARRLGVIPVARQLYRARQRWRTGFATFLRSLEQANALLERLRERDRLDSEGAVRLADCCRILCHESSRLQRIRRIRRLGLPDVHAMRKVVSYARIAMLDSAAASRVFTGLR